MIKEMLFGRTPIPTLTKGLDASHLRQRAIADNVANAQSSGYTRKVVDFEDELKGALSRRTGELFRTHPSHLPSNSLRPDVHAKVRQASDRIDGQGSEQVVIEREMANLAQTQIKYEAEAKLAKQYFELLNMSIRGTA